MKKIDLIPLFSMLPMVLLAQVAKSSNDNVSINFSLQCNGVSIYSMTCKGKAAVKPSRLGLEPMKDKHAPGELQKTDLMNGLTVKATQTSTFDETWKLVWGGAATIRNHYDELAITLHQTSSERNIVVRFRVYSEGVGLRYGFPQQDSLIYFLIKEEHTQFVTVGDHMAWWIPSDYDTQEQKTQQDKLSEIRERFHDTVNWGNSLVAVSLSTGVQTSLQMKSQGGLYINIHEAACADYSTMHPNLDGKIITFGSWFTLDTYDIRGCMQTPCKSPWRMIMANDDVRDVLSSNLILNLDESCKIEDTSRIHPTKYCGVWWEMTIGKSVWNYIGEFPSIRLDQIDWSKAKPGGRHVANIDKVRRYIGLTAKSGLNQVLVEEWNVGWEDQANHWKQDVFDFVTPYPGPDLKGLNEYAHSKGVKFLMHHETLSSAVSHGRRLKKAFNPMNQYGYDATKTGYVDDIIPHGDHHFSQSMSDHYMYAVKQAAKHHIMVNAHEATCPTGSCRTWSNIVGNESAGGGEYEALGGNGPDYTTILPFTRLQGGPMGYIPGIFVTKLSEWSDNISFVHSTLAGQLVLYMTMYSPLRTTADPPEHHEKYNNAFQFIRDVAVDWDGSKYLEVEPGDYVTVTRKAKGTDGQFIGGKCDENGHKNVIKLDFPDKDKKYRCTIYADVENAHHGHNP